MLALFEDGGSLTTLRTRIGAVGTRVLGELNSRPKALLHVSCGRLLDWPAELPDVRSAARVARVAARWATRTRARARARARAPTPTLSR